MAGRTLGPELAVVMIILQMAGHTILWHALEDTIDMAALAGHGSVLTVQIEGELGMIDFRISPTVRRVTARAVRPKLTIMMIVLQVAGNTVLRGAFEDTIDVAAFTTHIRVFAVEMEGKLGMVYPRIFPAIGGVTCGAIRAELAVVMVILRMA